MRIVSENSGEDLAKRQAEQSLGFVLREMAANLLRVIRGAGKPYDVGRNIADCIRAYGAYRDAYGHYPPSDLVTRMLDPDRPWPIRDADDDRKEGWRADFDKTDELNWQREGQEREIRRAALQITASILIEQLTQAQRGERDLYDAMRRHERASAELSAHWAAQRSASLPAKRPRPPRRATPAAVRPLKDIRPVKQLAPAPAAPVAVARPTPKPKAAVDPLKPPPYEVRHDFPLPDDLKVEFEVQTVLELVGVLNEAWKAQGRRPLAQGSFPRNAATLAFVVKELRRALST